MLKTYLYLPDYLNEKIEQLAKSQKQSKAEVIRVVLEKGLQDQQVASGAEVMVKIAELAKKEKVIGSKDSSEKFDDQLWGKDWSGE